MSVWLMFLPARNFGTLRPLRNCVGLLALTG